MLLVPDRANAPAQVELITNGQIDATAMPVLERQLGQTAQQVLDQLLGGRAAMVNRTGRSSSPATLDSDNNALSSHSFDELLQTTEHLWREDFAKVLSARLDSREDLQSDPALLGLVTSLPKHTLRTALLRRWKTNWIDDATLAQGSALVSPGMRRPGIAGCFAATAAGTVAGKGAAHFEPLERRFTASAAHGERASGTASLASRRGKTCAQFR